MKNETKDLVASLRDRLQSKAKITGVPFQEILEHYAIFQFLNRLSASRYRDQLILKGALAFLGWGLTLRRPTRDIDLQANTVAAGENMVEIVRAICQHDAGSNPLTFDMASIKAAPIMLQADQTGVRVKLAATLGNIRIPMQIDFSFANVITPGPILMHYPSPLDRNHIDLKGYPPETSIAEKVEALVAWSTATSRFKDFFDIWFLSQECVFDGAVLRAAIQATFANRKTPLPDGLPPALTQEFAAAQQRQWAAFIRNLSGQAVAYNDFAEVMAQIRDFIYPVLQAANSRKPFAKSWSPEDQWT
jgi:hypothetical protein